ncbi:hypothetical protein LO80_09590 [Candidatus Francisella endociliophora]|uniref:Uncharacterized protein n=1 Tax=Candidatus Francisella endociliophora TaxID=653937 RepID=A0A097ERJ5_9GAMM|nr:hypothetical protein [Francisella sp. FSC1006]AIT10196.1 hypothetical protein LO80_09590 [Francisella sp. FSC1006]
MTNKERIIIRYLGQRWYKKALIISASKQVYFSKINALKLVVCSGYLQKENPVGCKFAIDAWPFEHKFFDLIILDDSLVDCPKQMKSLLEQLHFCLADDGEVIVASTGKVRLYKVVSKFLANGFLSRKLHLINYTNNFVVNITKKIISKNFVVVFKKDNFFTTNVLNVEELVKKPAKNKVYSGGCVSREVYEHIQEKK